MDKVVKLEELPLSIEDRKELKRQNTIFIGGVLLMLMVGFMVVFLLLFDPWWRLGVGLPILGLALVFASSAASNFRDLSYGKKQVRTGRVWDVYERITIPRGKNSPSADWKFFFRLGEEQYPYFDFSVERERQPEPDLLDKARRFEVGQTVEMHFTRSGYRLKEVVLREAPASGPKAARLEAKIMSNCRLTQAMPPKWDASERGKFFYFSFGGTLVKVDEQRFDEFVVGCEALLEGNLLSDGRYHVKAKTVHGNWLYLS